MLYLCLHLNFFYLFANIESWMILKPYFKRLSYEFFIWARVKIIDNLSRWKGRVKRPECGGRGWENAKSNIRTLSAIYTPMLNVVAMDYKTSQYIRILLFARALLFQTDAFCLRVPF